MRTADGPISFCFQTQVCNCRIPWESSGELPSVQVYRRERPLAFGICIAIASESPSQTQGPRGAWGYTSPEQKSSPCPKESTVSMALTSHSIYWDLSSGKETWRLPSTSGALAALGYSFHQCNSTWRSATAAILATRQGWKEGFPELKAGAAIA